MVVLECDTGATAGVCAPSPADKLSVDRALVEADGDEKDLARILDVDASVLAGGDKTTLRQRAERAVACSSEESRRFVVVSLAEAEALRALCHSGGGAALRLRGLSATNAAFDGDSSVEASILGTTTTITTVDGQLDRRTARVLSFCDVDLDPSHGAVEQLRRCLGNEEKAAVATRCDWWEALRGCKRRSRRAWVSTPLAPLFGKATSTDAGSRGDDARATLVRCAAELDRRSMSPADCFEAFDADGDGILTRGELAVGLRWLLSRARPATCLAVAVFMDADEDGMISRDEFVKAFDAKDPAPTAPPAAAVSAQDVLKCCSFSIDSITTKAVALWDARGCLANARGSRSEASIWAADLADPHWKRGMLGTATLSVPLGVFGHGSRKNPTNAKLLTISARRFKRVDVTAVRDRWLPTAVAFRRLWEITTGRTSLYVWTPVAPEGFISIGLGVSTTPEPPALDSVRCLPQAWVVPATAKPRLLFDNVGMQSRKPGGLWRIGSMGLLALGRDRDPPELALDLNPAFTSIAPDAAAPPLPPRNMPVAYAHAAPASAVGTLPVATAF